MRYALYLFIYIFLLVETLEVFAIEKSIPSNSILADTLTLPADFPPLKIMSLDKPAPGVILFPCSGKGYGSYIVFMDTLGKVIKYKKTSANVSNYSVQPNGMIIFNMASKGIFKAYSESKIFIADTALNIVDSIVSGNGFIPSPHTSSILPNGNYLYSSFEPHYVDMSKVVPNGNPNALVAGAVLVEMDINKNVVFQWRSWDYIPIEDTYQPINDFLNVTTLYSNFNSVDIDKDGNYLISNRLLSEITKVDRKSGDIIWRLGGKHNEFEFIDERPEKKPFYFSLQHDIRVLPNGNITIFDNGDQHQTPASRGLEYKLDQVKKTATLVWDYEPQTTIIALSAGSAQRQKNGNTIISWGNLTSTVKRDITEVNPDGKVSFELALPANNVTFKALKFPYPIGIPESKVTKYELVPENTYTFDNGNSKTGVTLVFSKIYGFMYNTVDVTKFNYAPVYPKFNINPPFVFPYRYTIETNSIDSFATEIHIKLNDMEWMHSHEQLTLFVRDTIGTGFFTPLNTIYNQSKNELVAQTNKFGEFIIARIENFTKPNGPILVSPIQESKQNNRKPIKFTWSPKGYFTSSKFEISDIKNFSKIEYSQSNLKSNSLTINNLSANKIYFWRVSTSNGEFESDWSQTGSFTTSDPFIKLKTPIGGEKLLIDSSTVIYWEHNITDSVRIELYRNGTFLSVIKDSLLSFTGAFAWKIPKTIVEDSTYQIKVVSIKDVNLNSLSSNFFSIKNGIVSVDEFNFGMNEISNYPNPFGYTTLFTIKINTPDIYSLRIYDLLGIEQATLINQYLSVGEFQFEFSGINLSSGLYIYVLESRNKQITGRIIKND